MLAIFTPGVKNIILATLFFGAINALVKYLGHIPATELVFFRSIVSFFIGGFFVWKHKLQIYNKDNFWPLIARGTCGSLGLLAFFSSIQRIPLASAVTILYLAPIFTVMMAIFINKESPRKIQWPFMILSFLGAVMLKGTDYRIGGGDFLLGLSAALFSGLAYNFIRKLRNKAHPHLVVFYFPLVTLPFVTPYVIAHWYTPTLTEFLLLILLGVLTQFAQFFMTKAYMLEAAHKIGHFNYLTCIYAWLCGILFFDETIPTDSVIALGIIVTGVVFCTHLSRDAGPATLKSQK